jgi:hypothetical protein
VRQTAKILYKLIRDGKLDAADGILYTDFRSNEVRQELDIWGEEFGFSLLDIRGRVYMIPDADSELLAFKLQDVREAETRGDRNIDAFLQCYISMTILWQLYGGKNVNPKRVTFLQVNDIVHALDERFSEAVKGEAPRFEAEYEINFRQISEYWASLQVDDEHRRKTRIGFVLRSCRLMEQQRLLIFTDEEREIRPTERLDDLMIGYYLNNSRIEGLHELFSTLEEGNAKAE